MMKVTWSACAWRLTRKACARCASTAPRKIAAGLTTVEEVLRVAPESQMG